MRWLGRLLPWLSRRSAFSQLEGKRRGAGRAGLPNGYTNLPPGSAGRRLNKRLPRGRVAYHGAGARPRQVSVPVDVLRLSTACGKCLSGPWAGPRRLASWRPTPRSAQPLPAPPHRIRCRPAPFRPGPLPRSSPARSHRRHLRLSRRAEPSHPELKVLPDLVALRRQAPSRPRPGSGRLWPSRPGHPPRRPGRRRVPAGSA